MACNTTLCKQVILKDLGVCQDENSPQIVMALLQEDGSYNVPFHYGVSNGHYKTTESPASISCTFSGTLREYQHDTRKKIIDNMNKKKCVILSSFVGSGKTIIAINIATKIKLQTLIVVNRVLLATQWQASICEFTSTQYPVPILSRKTIECTSDFAIVNGVNIDKIPKSVLDKFGFVIVDECHALMSGKVGQKLLHLTPKYLMGLSATAYRYDGFQQMFGMYFGGDDNTVVTKLYRKHNVYKVQTQCVIESKINMYSGQVDFNAIINALTRNESRNQQIVQTVVDNPDKVFLVLVKRVDHGDILKNLFENIKIPVQCLFGACGKNFVFTTNVLIATCSKAGVGFDCPRLNTLIIAAPIKNYFIQYLGRVMRTQESEPTVFDFVDDNAILKQHWYARRRVYLEHGGILVPV